ncbi:glycoside hydrolase family 3 N-terminal domain-containing protein [Actinomyces polynesiensis]|uniref:glycoside hydrolase family 3 N-terminal domain-containing protein n=1 Tax=Actinomyces polynesiensis TaxID=1325934 RepID=UPI000B22D5B0|nr:glycoside hydrolase family 3 N-terminal domain-containing protein [Actinomyces polynesiensis]
MIGASTAQGRPPGHALAGWVYGLGILACVLGACTPSTAPGSGTAAPVAPPSGSSAPASSAPVSSTPDPGRSTTPPAPPSSAPTPSAADPLQGWTLEQEVGQLFMVGVDVHKQQSASWAAVTDHHVGNVFIAGRSQAGQDHVLALVRSFTDLVSADTTRSTPMLVATDQEGGAVQVLRGPGFSVIPSALSQSGMTPARLESEAAGWGRELSAAGITLDLAPVMDLVDGDPASNPPIGAWDRQYGDTADSVVAHANAFSRGMRSAGVAVAIKHFPGLGRVGANTDTTAGVTDTVTTRHDASVGVFARGIADGAEMIMMSTAVYRRIDADAPAAFSPVVVGDVLRGDLGFGGVVITDDVSAAVQVQAWTPGERAVCAIDAGCDIVLVSAAPEQAGAMVDAVVSRARQDPAFAAKVRASALRVLALKASMPDAGG